MSAIRRTVPVIGLVGGIGSGKSALARELKNRRRIEIVEGDSAGHEVLKENSIKEQIRSRFGERVFGSDGGIDRPSLSRLVFGSSAEHTANRAALEAIVHPRITEILRERIAQTRGRPGVELVLLDAAVLLEAGWSSLCDHVVYVDAPHDERLARVARTRGWSAADLQAREGSQFTLERKRQEADHVVCNDGPLAAAVTALEAHLSKFLPPEEY